MATVEDRLYIFDILFQKNGCNTLWRKITTTFRLKIKQITCLYDLLFGRDVIAILPTGFGKSSYIFHFLPDFVSLKKQKQHRHCGYYPDQLSAFKK